MTTGCQVLEPFAVAVAGVAGSGKSTLGRAVARRLRAPLLDLDTLTNPLLDALGAEVFDGHWLASRHAALVRRVRYAALLATAAEVLGSAGRVVLVAPFTAELAGGDAWRALEAATRPATLRMVRLVGSPELFAARRAGRGTVRDQHRPTGAEAGAAAVPVLDVDAEQPRDVQLEQVLRDLGVTRPDPR